MQNAQTDAGRPGEIIGGEYLVESVLAESLEGGIYRVRRIGLRFEGWLRRIRGHLSTAVHARECYLHDTRAIATSKDPALARVLDVGKVEPGGCFYVTSRLSGYPLRAWLAAGRPPLETALRLAIRLGRALASAHELGVVHGELSPDCVLASAGGGVHVLDVGIRHLRRRADVRSPCGQALPYAPPELSHGGRATVQTDVYAVAAIIHELVSGKRPFAAPGPEAQRRARSASDIPYRLALILDRALAPSPLQRTPSLLALVEPIEQLLADWESRPRPKAPPGRQPQPALYGLDERWTAHEAA